MKIKTQKIEFELESISPLLMDKWTGDTEQPKTKEGYLEQAELKAYRNNEGKLIIPSNALKASIRYAANELVGVRKGKAMRQTIRACLIVDHDLSLNKTNFDSIREDIVTRKGTGDKVTRVPTYRPCINEWKTKGIITFIQDGNLTKSFIKQSLEFAGIKYGLLGYRPEFGRFKVTKFK